VTGSWTVPAGVNVGNNFKVGYFVDVNNSVNEGPSEVIPWDSWSGWSASFSVTVPAPSTPTSFVANSFPTTPAACGGKINLAWGASTDADSYEISLNNGGNWPYTGIVGTSRTISGLPVNTTYNNILIRARNTTDVSGTASTNAISTGVCTGLGGPGCEIPNGRNSCTTDIDWDLTGATAPSIYNLTRSSSISSGVLIGAETITLERSDALGNRNTGENIIQTRDGVTIIRERTLTATCRVGSFFHPVLDNCLLEPPITLGVVPASKLVRSGNIATINTSIDADYDLNCTFSGGLVGGGPIVHRASPAIKSYSNDTSKLYSAQIIQLTCRIPGYTAVDDPKFIRTERINVIPNLEDI
jgi:hypothetical protein